MATKLMPLRLPGSALRSLSKRRPSQHAFSTSPATAALSPHSKSSQKITSEPARRTQATAAAPAQYGCRPDLEVVVCAPLTDAANPDKPDPYPVLRSIRIFDEVMSRRCKIANYQRWTNRGCACLGGGVHVLTISTASSASVVAKSFTR